MSTWTLEPSSVDVASKDGEDSILVELENLLRDLKQMKLDGNNNTCCNRKATEHTSDVTSETGPDQSMTAIEHTMNDVSEMHNATMPDVNTRDWAGSPDTKQMKSSGTLSVENLSKPKPESALQDRTGCFCNSRRCRNCNTICPCFENFCPNCDTSWRDFTAGRKRLKGRFLHLPKPPKGKVVNKKLKKANNVFLFDKSQCTHTTMVRVGGGYTPLVDYLKSHNKVVLSKVSRKAGSSYFTPSVIHYAGKSKANYPRGIRYVGNAMQQLEELICKQKKMPVEDCKCI